MEKYEWVVVFGENLRRLMEERGYSLRRLSNRTGIRYEVISTYRSGKSTPNLHTALRLAKGLGCDLNELACTDCFMEAE